MKSSEWGGGHFNVIEKICLVDATCSCCMLSFGKDNNTVKDSVSSISLISGLYAHNSNVQLLFCISIHLIYSSVCSNFCFFCQLDTVLN